MKTKKNQTKKFQKILATIVVLLLLSLPNKNMFALETEIAVQESDLSVFVNFVDISNFPEIRVHLSAWNGSGLPLIGLEVNDFLLQEDSGDVFHPTRIINDENANLSVMMVLDTSESMAGDPINSVRDSATRFLDLLKPTDRVAITIISNYSEQFEFDAKTEIGFSGYFPPAYDLVENLIANGQTNLYYSVSKAAYLTSLEINNHRAILLLSDGRNDSDGIDSAEGSLRMVKDANVPFFIIGYGGDIDQPYLQMLADESGGLFRISPKSIELRNVFQEMSQLLKTQYVLIYKSTLPLNGEMHALTVYLNRNEGTDIQVKSIGPFPLVVETPENTTDPIVEEIETEAIMPAEYPQKEDSDIDEIPPSPNTPVVNKTEEPIVKYMKTSVGAILLVLFLYFIYQAIVYLPNRRKPKKPKESCVKCGHDVTYESGACTVCGETERHKDL